MTAPRPSLSLTVSLTVDQIGFLAYFYPNDGPEDSLIKLLERRWVEVCGSDPLLACFSMLGQTTGAVAVLVDKSRRVDLLLISFECNWDKGVS